MAKTPCGDRFLDYVCQDTSRRDHLHWDGPMTWTPTIFVDDFLKRPERKKAARRRVSDSA